MCDNYLRHYDIEKWQEMQMYFMFPKINSAQDGLVVLAQLSDRPELRFSVTGLRIFIHGVVESCGH